MDETVILGFTGRIGMASFEEFARHRAARLALGLTVLGLAAHAARFAVSGPPDLIDAFEMALSLGPSDCLVLEVTRATNGPDARQTGIAG